MNIKLISVLCFLPFFFSCEENQEKEVPEEIRHSFQESNPDASDVVWSHKGEGYEVDFKDGDRAVEFEFDKDGKVVEEEVIISKADLPVGVSKYLEENYPQLHIGEASIEKKNGETVYELELLNGFFRDIELEFDINGVFLRKESFNE